MCAVRVLHTPVRQYGDAMGFHAVGQLSNKDIGSLSALYLRRPQGGDPAIAPQVYLLQNGAHIAKLWGMNSGYKIPVTLCSSLSSQDPPFFSP
jgi:hypothetical protein